MSKVLMSLVLLLMSVIRSTVSTIPKCTDLSQLTNIQQVHRLQGTTFLSIDIKGIQQCARECLYRTRCKSFNFYVEFGQCELNLNTSVEAGTLVSEVNFIYSDISDWTQGVAGVCANNACSFNQQCVPSLSPSCQDCAPGLHCGVCGSIQEVSGKAFQSYGCFNSIPRVLPHLLANFRDQIDWSNINSMILLCAATAVSSGYEFFGIEYYGECYGGNAADANFADPVTIAECADKCWGSVGATSVMAVYNWI